MFAGIKNFFARQPTIVKVIVSVAVASVVVAGGLLTAGVVSAVAGGGIIVGSIAVGAALVVSAEAARIKAEKEMEEKLKKEREERQKKEAEAKATLTTAAAATQAAAATKANVAEGKKETVAHQATAEAVNKKLNEKTFENAKLKVENETFKSDQAGKFDNAATQTDPIKIEKLEKNTPKLVIQAPGTLFAPAQSKNAEEFKNVPKEATRR